MALSQPLSLTTLPSTVPEFLGAAESCWGLHVAVTLQGTGPAWEGWQGPSASPTCSVLFPPTAPRLAGPQWPWTQLPGYSLAQVWPLRVLQGGTEQPPFPPGPRLQDQPERNHSVPWVLFGSAGARQGFYR